MSKKEKLTVGDRYRLGLDEYRRNNPGVLSIPMEVIDKIWVEAGLEKPKINLALMEKRIGVTERSVFPKSEYSCGSSCNIKANLSSSSIRTNSIK